jgi:hypothetical protein
MTKNELSQAIAVLKTEVHGLFTAELADAPGKSDRIKQSHRLNDQWLKLQQAADALPAQDRKLITLDLEAAKRDLIFLLASADDEPDLVTLEDQVRQINHESFELAKKAAAQPAAFATQAHDLHQRLIALLKEPGSNEPDIQRLASDAALELDFILQGGNVPTSTRLASYLRGLKS